MSANLASATGPIPHSFRTGSGSRIPCWSCTGMTKVPSDLAKPDPILANCFPAPAPTDDGSPVSSLMRFLRCSAHLRTSSGVAPLSSSGSMKASSTLSCSISPASSRRISITRRDAVLYTSKRGLTVIPEYPTKRRARIMGIAEWTPNTRAS